MIIKKFKTLDRRTTQEVLELEKACNDYEQLQGSVFLDTSLNFNQDIHSVFLLYDDKKLISMLSMFIPSHSEVEISALTRPENRQNGCFKTLLGQACQELRLYKIPGILFVCEEGAESGKQVVKALNAELDHSEYYMSLFKGEQDYSNRSSLSLVKSTAQDLETLIALSIRIFEDNYEDARSLMENTLNSRTREQFRVVLADRTLGLVSVNHLSEEESSIFGLGILPEYRRKGWGAELLSLVLRDLWSRGKQQAVLEVDSGNKQAFRLYQKMGFRIVLAYDYYRRKVADFSEF